jgi:hypothetical protein
LPPIGRRIPVSLRDIWPRESDFSDWLISEDGLEIIADDIGLEMEDPRREQGLGDFPCDISGHLLGEVSHKVVIENQFGRTDHDHLGKLLTHAAMHSAMTGIWLAEKVSDDHRKVIDWLNDNTPKTVSFFLAEIKAYRIGDSSPAPQLIVVSRPNLQAKIEGEDTRADLKERHIWRKQMWEEILGYIRDQKPAFRVQSASTDAWSNIAIGRGHFAVSLTLTPKRRCIGCELWMNPPWKEDAFAQLADQREAIEAEIGQPLQWKPLEGKTARILLEAPIDPADPANRDSVKEWMYKHAVAFYRAFRDRVQKLQPRMLGDDPDRSQ